ncbi:MAG TPA: hypothetical protein VJB58_01000 [Candidatus Paceibacterota bacterium]
MKSSLPKKKSVTLETIASSIEKLDTKFTKKFIDVETKIGQLDKKIDDRIEELAISTAKGFKAVDIRFTEMENKLNAKIDFVERSLSGKIDGVDRRIDDLAITKSTKGEYQILSKRLDQVEAKVGIKAY